ncbi:MAG: DNA translocase FtsK [Defluviitaleaceae bacterium]|nr:DNA translocase FtsK [Defluviitaleaceae bacterium]MCL2263317.1 DNA translocase FtsK [Defluviitaleaceae bacterium]
MPRRTTRPIKNKVTEKPNSLQKEVLNLSFAAVGILLLLAMIGALGPVGAFLRNFLFGFFGVGAFVLPVGVLAFSVCRLIARDLRLPVIKIVALYWLILSMLHIFIFTREEGVNIFVDVYTAGVDSGGGIFGMLIGGPANTLLDTVGASIAIVAAIIILLVLITKRSFVQIVGLGVGKARDYYEEAKQYDDDYEEEESNVIPLNNGYRGRRTPPPVSPVVKKKSNLIELGERFGEDDTERDEEYDTPPPPKILLVNEELDGKHRDRQVASPLFAPRPAVQEAEPEIKPSAVMHFPQTISINGAEDYSQRPEYNAFRDMTPPTINSPDLPDSPDEIFEEDEAVVLPVDSENADYGEGLVVKGLVDDAAPNDDEPLFGDDDDDMLQYDEYAAASGTSHTGATEHTSMTASNPQDFENYEMPSLNLLAKNERSVISAESRTQVLENSRILEETLRSFKIESKVMEVSVGPTVTRYDLSPGAGVKVSSITNLSNDLALSLAAQGLRIEAPVPGKSAVGIEIPNKEAQGVFLREILEDDKFANFPSKLAFAVGKDIAGSPVITDIARMPHLLIAGATGSGKSVCINTLIASLLYKARPDEVKLLMIDPKVVELSVYNGIPHLLIPVVTDPKKASGALSWAVAEMETRYNMFAETGCRELKGYNKFATEKGDPELPQILIIIDELADLMMTCKGEVEESICRLAQKARAAGIHLIVATQRPSVDVITGLIKANIPSRLAFAVSSGTDSRTVLDMYGAEKLLGKGDMLFLPMGQNKPVRVQGGFISDKEVENLVAFLKAQAPVVHSVEEIQKVTMPGKAVIEGEVDEFFHDAVEFLLAKGKGSTSMLQRQFRIGYNRASRLMDDLQKRGIVGPEDGVKPRKVTITREEYKELYG